MDCLSFRWFCVWPEECSFLTFFTVSLSQGMNWQNPRCLLACFLSFWHLEKPVFLSLQKYNSKCQRKAWVSVQAPTDTLEFTWSFSAPELYHSTYANTKHPHILSSQYHMHALISTCEISVIHTPQTLISFAICVCFHGAALYELEKEPGYWDAQARATLDAALKLHPRKYRAKNIILFLGDGMSCYHCGHLFQQTLQRGCGWSLNSECWQIQLKMK